MRMIFLVILLVLTNSNNKTWAGDVNYENLLSPSALKMFVDEVPDMPRVSGFGLKNGVSVPKSLKIGMYFKKWVSNNSPFFSFIICSKLMFKFLMISCIMCSVFSFFLFFGS